MITPSIDGHNKHSERAWDGLLRKVTASLPTLIDSLWCFHSDQRAYTRYPQAQHSSESRIDRIFYSPPTATFLTPQSASI